jgi:uncharacterized protein YodC (DUF2158 family)
MIFNLGEVVQLKSGGPKMTIKGIVGDEKHSLTQMEENALKFSGYVSGSILCVWFLDNKLVSGVFKPEMLNKIVD